MAAGDQIFPVFQSSPSHRVGPIGSRYSKPIGMKFFSFQRELEALLLNKVDVVTSDGLSKYVLPYIEKDKILIYEVTA
jgi:hypothetical protein